MAEGGGLNLSGTVDIPVIGRMPKTYVALGLAVSAGIVGLAWYRHRTADDSGDASPGDYYADLRTGSAGKDEGYVNPGGIDTGDDEDDGDRAPRTNQEWSARVLDKLSWYEQGYVSRVISAYLARLEVTSEEANVIREAWAQVGRPPEGDIPIRIKGTPVTPPPESPAAAPAAPRLHHVRRTSTSLRLEWYGVSGAKTYVAYCNGAGKNLVKSGITGTTHTFTGLRPGTTYHVSVASVTAAGRRSGGTSNVIKYTTAG